MSKKVMSVEAFKRRDRIILSIIFSWAGVGVILALAGMWFFDVKNPTGEVLVWIGCIMLGGLEAVLLLVFLSALIYGLSHTHEF